MAGRRFYDGGHSNLDLHSINILFKHPWFLIRTKIQAIDTPFLTTYRVKLLSVSNRNSIGYINAPSEFFQVYHR